MAATCLSLLSLLIPLCASAAHADDVSAPVRIYYASTWSRLESAVGMRLKKGGHLKRRGIRAVVDGVPLFQTPPRPWADYDLLIAGQGFPANRITKGYRGKIVATLGSGGELSVLSPPGSAAKRAGDLKGGSIKTLMRNALHLYVQNWLREGGVDPAKVRLIPYDSRAFSFAQLRDDRSADAFVTWSPLTEKLLAAEGWRRLAGPRGQYFTTVLMSQRLLDRPHEAHAVLLALLDAAAEGARKPAEIDLGPDQEPFQTFIARTLRLRGKTRVSDIIDPEPMRQARRRWRPD